MMNNGFKRCYADHYCYVRRKGSGYLFLLLYVDDMLIAGSSMHDINVLKRELSKTFEMNDLGAVN